MTTNVKTYGPYLKRAIAAILSAIDNVNSVHDPYYKESSTILFANAWELLAKALLIKKENKKSIFDTGRNAEKTISAEKAVKRLDAKGYIRPLQAVPIQQLISLRNEACHTALPEIPDEILFHLDFYAVKYFKEVLESEFPKFAGTMKRNFLSVSFDANLTYSDRVKRLVRNARRKNGVNDTRLAYLLERGAAFDGSEYMKQSDFNKVLRDRRTAKPLYKLKIGDYARRADMVIVVPIQAPTGTHADIKLEKSRKGTLSISMQKRSTDDDYPYITSDLAANLGKSPDFVSRMIADLCVKGNPAYYQRIRTGNSSYTHKYSDVGLALLARHIKDHPKYCPPTHQEIKRRQKRGT